MKPPRGQSGHPYCALALALALLLASEPALASPGHSGSFAGAALLWLALCAVAYRLLRANLRYHEQLGRMEARLAEERQARVHTEQALADSHGVVCTLVLEQAGVRDAERSRIARDIHDDLGQNLLALRIDLSLMQVATNGIHPAIHHKVGLMASNLDRAIRSLRAVINNLRPLALGEGLRTAMERQLSEFTRLCGVEHELHVADDAFEACDDLRGADAIVYRVLQESLSNVARHARANRVSVTLARDGERLSLQVQDDGVGIGAPAAAGSTGLAGMRERAGAAGGQLLVHSRSGGGTVVELSLPVPSAQPAPSTAS
jgi:signal transduction histidine kinase